ncbi:MAG TPA: ComEC/Rec2 family competence protein [Candidatus Deferrimicrobium sp.]|nr:ComEC/Rec2 family competence protein [Candidatus Deferrimicrobium sp.]
MIRLRLVTLVALTVVAGALSAGTKGVTAILAFAVLASLGIVYVVQTRHPRLNLIRVVLALSLFWPSFAMAKRVIQSSASEQLSPDTSVVTGTALTPSVARSTRGMGFELSTMTANGIPLGHPVTVQVLMPDRRAGPTFGQQIRVSGKIGTTNPALNPGEERPGPPPPALFLGQDIQALPSHSLAAWWGRLTGHTRDLIELRARPVLSYRAFGFLEELLLHRRLFGTVDRHLFSITGTSHLLAISGLHLSLVFAVMSMLIGLMFSERSIGKTLAPLVATFVYLAFIDFPLSADRAFVMLCVFTVTRMFGGHTGRLASLSWAALILAVIDPASVFDIGLQLSLVSVAGLCFIGEPLSHLVRVSGRFARGLLSSLCSTTGASLPTAALAVSAFHVLAPVALLANVVAIPAVSLLLIGLLAWSVLLLAIPPLAALLAPILNSGSTLLFGCLELLGRLPGSHRNVPAPSSFLLLSLGILFGVVILTVDNRPRLSQPHHTGIPLAAAGMLVLLVWAFGAVPFDTRVTFPVVEQGSVILVRSRDIGTWLCLFDTDGKAANRAAQALAALGVNTLDVVVVAGSPADVPDQLDTLFGLLTPSHVYLPSQYTRTPIPGLDTRFQQTIASLDTGKMVSIEVGGATIQAGNASQSGPSMALVTAALVGAASPTMLLPPNSPGFAYDTSTGTVQVLTTDLASNLSLNQTGCISIFTRASRCWVAPDPRR